MAPNNMIHMRLVTFIVGPSTRILDVFGQNFAFRDLREGIIVGADFSTAMTKSIPPHAKAFRIIVSYKNWPFNFKVHRVLEVDLNNKFLYTGKEDDIYSQVRFVITNYTVIKYEGKKTRLNCLGF